jgi:hypothetical protein
VEDQVLGTVERPPVEVVDERRDERSADRGLADAIVLEPERRRFRVVTQRVAVRPPVVVRKRRVEPLEILDQCPVLGLDVEAEAQRVERTGAVQAQRRLGATCTAR